MSTKHTPAVVPPFTVQNEDWIVRELGGDRVEIISTKDPKMKLVGTSKALASAQAVLSELARHVADRGGT